MTTKKSLTWTCSRYCILLLFPLQASVFILSWILLPLENDLDSSIIPAKHLKRGGTVFQFAAVLTLKSNIFIQLWKKYSKIEKHNNFNLQNKMPKTVTKKVWFGNFICKLYE